MKGRILPGKVLIKKDEYTLTPAGVILPSTVKDIENIGTVVMVGEIPEKINIELSIGDKVLYSKFSNNENNKIKIEDVEYMLISITDIQYIF